MHELGHLAVLSRTRGVGGLTLERSILRISVRPHGSLRSRDAALAAVSGPGCCVVVGVVLWIVLSLGFSVYIRNFSSYGAAYGAFGAAIVLLLWLYLSANAFLFGAELNAELERSVEGDQASSGASSRSVSSGG